MSREKSLRKYTIDALRSLDACAVENSACPGFPDVEFIGGTMELKVLTDWPRRPTTVVRVPKFRPGQRNWLRARWKRGGLSLLLLRVDCEHLLFDGYYAAERLGYETKDVLIEKALRYWGPRRLRKAELLEEVEALCVVFRCAKTTFEAEE